MDAGGESALTSYLQENWAEDEYIVIGLKTNPRNVATYPTTPNNHDYYNYAADAELTIDLKPDITEVEISEASLQRIHDITGDGEGDTAHGSPANNLVGYFERADVENMHMAWSFLMTGAFSGERIAYADFGVEQTGLPGNAYSFDIEAHAIRTSPGSAIVTSDYQDTSQLLMTNFDGNNTAGPKTLDAGGESALTTYLQENWQEGEYLVIGLKTDPVTMATFPGGTNCFFVYATDAQLTVGVLPPQGSFVVVR